MQTTTQEFAQRTIEAELTTITESVLEKIDNSVVDLVWQEVAALTGSMPADNMPLARATPETMWDAIVLVGMPVVGTTGTAILVFSLTSCLVFQSFMVSIIRIGVLYDLVVTRNWQLVAQTQGPSLAEMWLGAVSVIASAIIRFVGLLLGVSFEAWATLSPALALWMSQAGLKPGDTTNNVAVLLWTLFGASELWRALGVAWAFCSLPRRSTRLTKLGDTFVFVSISQNRLVFVLAVAFARVCITVAVLLFGAAHLAGAKDARDAFVSFMALGFILDVPRHFWVWVCNGKRWTDLLAIEARNSFVESLIDNWHPQAVVAEEQKPSAGVDPMADRESCVDVHGPTLPQSRLAHQGNENL